MAFESDAAKLAEAIKRGRLRMAERELRIARLERIGADTSTLRDVLRTSRHNLELEYLYRLAQSYAELAAAKHADLAARTGIVLPVGGWNRAAQAAAPLPDAAAPPPASAPGDRDQPQGASGNPRKA
jgi:hypothetical protein